MILFADGRSVALLQKIPRIMLFSEHTGRKPLLPPGEGIHLRTDSIDY
jgi:hypothetical protein